LIHCAASPSPLRIFSRRYGFPDLETFDSASAAEHAEERAFDAHREPPALAFRDLDSSAAFAVS
jgi:hypothetical protein